MTKLYHKGKYGMGEWGKHLRPFLKTTGNRKWRRTAAKLNPESESLVELPKTRLRGKPKKTIQVKFRMKMDGLGIRSYYAKYATLRAAKDAMKRNSVIEARFLK